MADVSLVPPPSLPSQALHEALSLSLSDSSLFPHSILVPLELSLTLFLSSMPFSVKFDLSHLYSSIALYRFAKMLHFPIWAGALWIIALLLLICSSHPAASDPQTSLLIFACSTYNSTNLSNFYANLNGTFSDIRSQLSSANFATAVRARVSDPVYTLFQCRDYLSPSDCLSCFSVAVSKIRNCSIANGARVIYDGCFLRYESSNFFDQTTQPGDSGFCGNRTTVTAAGFNETVQKLLQDLYTATPKTDGYWAAAKREAAGAAAVYGVAQCPPTVSEVGCGDCLRVAYGNIQGCPPDGDGTATDAGCFLRYSSSAFFNDNQTVNIAPYLRAVDHDTPVDLRAKVLIYISGRSSTRKAIIGGVVGGVGFLLLLALLLFLALKHSKKARKSPKGDILGATELRGPVNFHYRDLKSATRNFSDENKLGGGGFGDVYKGLLKNKKTVAVKKLMISQSDRAKADFESEAKLICNVHHRHLIRLLGCCKKDSELLLVYEYMAKGSLDKYLFGDSSETLTWKQRFDIILGTARGLAYLHEEFHARIIHRDIKCSNILLDDEVQAKIADFGLARLLPEDKSHLSTQVAGTLGYTAPEYAMHGQLSEKVDTYSFGVVVLEIISGLKSNDMSREPAKQYLLEWVTMLLRLLYL
ncbi:hypothetical protein ACLOJK_014447 [Asimina triloba]